ncbi:MAG: hypothetical protein KAI09_04515 [Dehalococcoidales bacterium]|nr:hypothetical protein [Dehalococcoidales bacterium]
MTKKGLLRVSLACHCQPFASCHSEGEKRPKNLVFLFTLFRVKASPRNDKVVSIAILLHCHCEES